MFTKNYLVYILVDMDYLFFLFYLFVIWNSVYVQFDNDLWPTNIKLFMIQVKHNFSSMPICRFLHNLCTSKQRQNILILRKT